MIIDAIKAFVLSVIYLNTNKHEQVYLYIYIHSDQS